MWTKWRGGGWVLVCFHGVFGKRSPSRSRGYARRLDDILLYGLPQGVVVYAVI